MIDERKTLQSPSESQAFKKGKKIGNETIERIICEGSQGVIFELKNSDRLAKVYFNGFESDKELVKKIKFSENPYILKIYETGMKEGHYFEIVKKYKKIEKLYKNTFDKEAAAINALHDLGYAHLDIKKEHFMEDEDGNIVLIDIGCATKFGEKYYRQSSQFSPTEIYSHTFDKGTDYFSFGIAILEQFFPLLFFGMNRQETIEFVTSSKRFEQCEKIPVEFRDDVKTLLSDNIKARNAKRWFKNEKYCTSANLFSLLKSDENLPQADIQELRAQVQFELTELAHKGSADNFFKIKKHYFSSDLNDVKTLQNLLKETKATLKCTDCINYSNITKDNALYVLSNRKALLISKTKGKNLNKELRKLCKKNNTFYIIRKSINDTYLEIENLREKRAKSILKAIGLSLGALAVGLLAVGLVYIAVCVFAVAVLMIIIFIIFTELCG